MASAGVALPGKGAVPSTWPDLQTSQALTDIESWE